MNFIGFDMIVTTARPEAVVKYQGIGILSRSIPPCCSGIYIKVIKGKSWDQLHPIIYVSETLSPVIFRCLT